MESIKPPATLMDRSRALCPDPIRQSTLHTLLGHNLLAKTDNNRTRALSLRGGMANRTKVRHA